MNIQEKLQMLKDCQSVRPDAMRAKQIAEIEAELSPKLDVWNAAHDLCLKSIERINQVIVATESAQKKLDLVACRELLADHLQNDELTEETVKGFNLYHVTPLLPAGFISK